MRTWIGVRRSVVCMTIGLLAAVFPAASGQAWAQSAGPTPTAPPLNASVVPMPLAGGNSTINQNAGSAGTADLHCGDSYPRRLEAPETVDCSKTVLFVPGYSFDGSSRSCREYFAGALEEYDDWGYEDEQLVTVGLYHSDDRDCDVAVGDFGKQLNVMSPSGQVAPVNMHIWSSGSPENHEWKGGFGCGNVPGGSEDDWRFAPSHCWGHNKNTPIEHLAYHFGFLIEAYGQVDIVAHSLGGLVVQAAHSFSVKEQGRPARMREPYKSVANKYDDVVTSGTPYNGIDAANYHPVVDIPLVGSFTLDFCNGTAGADGRPTRINSGQCRQLRAGSPFMRAMRANMVYDSGGGSWSVIGSNAFGTGSDIPIEYDSATAHPTMRRYVYHRWGSSVPFRVPFSVTHSDMGVPELLGSYYYSYKEEEVCSASTFMTTAWDSNDNPVLVQLVDWPDCWDAGLFKKWQRFEAIHPTRGTVTLCQHPSTFPPGLTAEVRSWCHDAISPRHNRLAFLATTTHTW